MNKPELFIFAGINGAGKSSLAKITGMDQTLHIVNPDVIAKSLVGRSYDLPDGTNMKAGRIALEEREQRIQDKKSFGFESTLTSQKDFKTINDAIENGFSINLIYVGLNSAELAKERVESRVKNGGHDIPKETIERRYEKSIDNLKKALQLVDNAKIYDNSKDSHQLIFEIENKKITYENNSINDWAKNPVNEFKNILKNKPIEPKKPSLFEQAKAEVLQKKSLDSLKKEKGINR